MDKVHSFVFTMKFRSYWNAFHWAINDGYSMVIVWGDNNSIRMHLE